MNTNILEHDKYEKVSQYIKNKCKADDYSLNITASDSVQTRFAQNAITQHIAGANIKVDLNVAFGNKTGSASVNQIDTDSLDHLVESAEATAKMNEPDPEYVESAKYSQLHKINNYFTNTAELSNEDLVKIVGNCVENAKSKNAKVSGMTENHLVLNGLWTKNGFEGIDKYTHFSHSMTIKKENKETKVEKSVKNIDDFDINLEIRKLNSQLNNLTNPGKFLAKKIPVILRPAAVLHLFSFLLYMFNRRDADEGITPFTDKLNKKFFGSKFTLSSLLDEKLLTPKFVGDGIPSENIDWIKNGIIKNMRVSRSYAKQMDIKPLSQFNLAITGDKNSEAEMMKKVENGIIINRLWYIRFVDLKKGELTGLTRDGVLYFEDGKIKKAVNNLRWNEVIHDLTRRIIALGQPEQISSFAKVPPMLIDDFNFVDTTTF